MILLKTNSKFSISNGVFVLVILALFFGFIFTEPIAQQEHYHGFSNDLQLFQIQNFWNVITNLPFVILGLYGLMWWSRHFKDSKRNSLSRSERWFRLEPLLFFGIILIGLGSSYYHYNPNLSTLFWDRLPMALVFSTLFVIIIRDFVSRELNNRVKVIVVAFSVLSVVYWVLTEYLGRGDLRPYLLVQFMPMILIPYFLKLNKYKKSTRFIWYALGMYFLAKLAEHFDNQIFEFLNIMAGHPLKHLLAAGAMVFIFNHIRKQAKENISW